MAYQPRPIWEHRSPTINHESRVSPWASHQHPQHLENSRSNLATPTKHMDPESEGSDVSDADGEIGTNAFPVALPPAPSKQSFESQDALNVHLGTLESAENQNIRRHNRLREKRSRMDERLGRKRAIQDAKIRAIMDARTQRDLRIKQRREREDVAFARFYEDLEEEETRVRKRIKSLKRGMPVDDAVSSSRKMSGNSMSPPAPSYSTVPPPAQRHHSSYSSHGESQSSHMPSEGHPYPRPIDRPSYQFHPPHSNAPTPPQYHSAPPYHHQQAPHQSPHVLPSSRPAPLATESPFAANGRLPSSHHSPIAVPVRSPTGVTPLNTQPPRHPAASYDTRPPPPSAAPPNSGFAAVNQPSSSGFAAVNSRPTDTPPAAHSAHAKEQHHTTTSNNPENTPVRSTTSEEKANGGASASKRTPSTTHPYQMSEAFANRHHHCERTDSLNRGIWTWYGPKGTKDHPTAPATEMYLRCNHDGCGRIDWKTVHGLQCHIVKNHEQPKGTIGSLEKALAAYGVPVAEVEEVEKRNGIGSGGTMADPKNSKIKAKYREHGELGEFDAQGRRRVSSLQKPIPPPESPIIGYSTTPQSYDPVRHSNSFAVHSQSAGRQEVAINVDQRPPYQPVSGFAAVNSSWQGVNSTPSKRPASRDFEIREIKMMRPAHAESDEPEILRSIPVSDVKQNRPSSEHDSRTPSAPVQYSFAPATIERASHEMDGVPGPTRPEKPRSGNPRVSSTQAASKLPGTQEAVMKTSLPPRQAEDIDVPKVKDVGREVPMIEPKEAPNTVTETPASNDAPSFQPIHNNEPPSSAIASSFQPIHNSEPSADAPKQQAKENKIETPDEDEPTPTAKESEQAAPEPSPKQAIHSPEMMTTRRASRLGSRRASIATTSTKNALPRPRDEDMENVSAATTSSKAGSMIDDDDGDSITVNMSAVRRERLDDDEKARTPTRGTRLPNGRFTRRTR